MVQLNIYKFELNIYKFELNIYKFELNLYIRLTGRGLQWMCFKPFEVQDFNPTHE